MKLPILILLFAFCVLVDGHRLKSRQRIKGSASRLGVSFPRQFPFMEDLKVPAAEKLLTLNEFRSQINGVWWTALYVIATDDISPVIAMFFDEVTQEKLEWNLQGDGSVIRRIQLRPRIGEQCIEVGDDDFVAVSDKFAIFQRTRDGITREDRFLSNNPANYLIQYVCEDTSTIQRGKCMGGAAIEIYSSTDPPNVIEYDKIAFDLACGFWLNIGDRRSRLLYKGRRCEDDALFPREFEFSERIKIPTPMTRKEFREHVNGTVWTSLIIIGSDKLPAPIKSFLSDVVHEQLSWTEQPNDIISRKFVYRPKLGVPCVDVGTDSGIFRWASDEFAVMNRTTGSTTRSDIFVGGKGYLIQFVCNDITDIKGDPQTCGPENVVIDLYTDMSIPDKVPWHLVVADFEKIMLNLDDKRARWMYVDDRCPNRLV